MMMNNIGYKWTYAGSGFAQCNLGPFYACVADEGSGRWRAIIGLRDYETSLYDNTGFIDDVAAQRDCEQRLDLLATAMPASSNHTGPRFVWVKNNDHEYECRASIYRAYVVDDETSKWNIYIQLAHNEDNPRGGDLFQDTFGYLSSEIAMKKCEWRLELLILAIKGSDLESN